MKKGLFAAAGLLLAGATAVAAQAPAPARPAPVAPGMAPMPPMTALPGPMPKTRAEAVARARATFATFDRNRDGFITRDELPAMRAMATRPAMPPMPMPPAPHGGPGKAGMDGLFALMDSDRNGQISKAEFDAFHAGRDTRRTRVIVMRGRGAPPPGAMPPIAMERLSGMMLAMRFDRLDADHDGKLSAREAEAGALARFDRVDTDHDGMLSVAEIEAGRPRIAMRMRMRRAAPEGAPVRPGPGYDLPALPGAPPAAAPPIGY